MLLQRLYGWYGKRVVLGVLAVVIILVIIILSQTLGAKESSVPEVVPLPQVAVSSPAALRNRGQVEVIGTVSAMTQAKLLAEASGRVVAVNVSLGQQVSPGQIIAQLENASERAVVLQAEGAYESALVQAAQSDVSVEEANTRVLSALNAARSANQEAFTAVNDILLNTVDQLFSSPNSGNIGLRINGRGQTATLNAERVAFRSILTNWDTTLSVNDDAEEILGRTEVASKNAARLLAMIDIIIPLMSERENTKSFTDTEVLAIAAQLSAARARLTTTISNLESVRSAVESANDALIKAKLQASGGSSSLADAQTKQALGSLRAAQANFEKTIVRSPIAGTVNQLAVRAGDYVSMNAPVAEIANNSGLEVTTYFAEFEMSKLRVGDVVTLGDAATGTVTNISPAIDAATGKVEVRIGVTDGKLTAGSTVRVLLDASSTMSATTDAEVSIPLSAIKLGADNAFVFTVNADNILVANEVELGPVSGENVIVRQGLSATTPIVLDARGRKAGEKVIVVSN